MVTSSDLRESTDQGVISSFIIGRIISEKELALASPYRKLNDVFDEFLELQQQNNKVSGRFGLKKLEKKSELKTNHKSRNNRRDNNRKINGVVGNDERKREIAKRALRPKPINELYTETNKKMVAVDNSDKNCIQRNKLKKDNEESGSKIYGKRVNDRGNTADKASNAEVCDVLFTYML